MCGREALYLREKEQTKALYLREKLCIVCAALGSTGSGKVSPQQLLSAQPRHPSSQPTGHAHAQEEPPTAHNTKHARPLKRLAQARLVLPSGLRWPKRAPGPARGDVAKGPRTANASQCPQASAARSSRLCETRHSAEVKLRGSTRLPSLTSALISLKRGCLASFASWKSASSLLLTSTPEERTCARVHDLGGVGGWKGGTRLTREVRVGRRRCARPLADWSTGCAHEALRWAL